MKLITFAIPCYNSFSYMGKCIDSLLLGKEDVEIIIVNDGSTDRTEELAESYAKKYPDIIKVINKENGGHGSAVNAGLSAATGEYFKVVDSDDWVDEDGYKSVIEVLKGLRDTGKNVDMLLTNFVYDKVNASHKRVTSYTSMFESNRMLSWEDMRFNLAGVNILMHSVTYRTQILRDCDLRLPEHTFYVDNLFVYIPLPYVKSIYYINQVFYHYFIGREGQSVAEQTMVKRIDQQLKVNYMMIDAYKLSEMENTNIRRYMRKYLSTIMAVSSSIGYLSGSKRNLKKIRSLWKYLRRSDKRTFRKIRYSILGSMVNVPGKIGRNFSLRCYYISKWFFGFN